MSDEAVTELPLRDWSHPMPGGKPRREILVKHEHRYWVQAFRFALFLFAALIVGGWILLGLLFRSNSTYYPPAPAWGGYCERKHVGEPILEPINAWSSLSFIIFSALILCSVAEYRFLLGVRNVRAFTEDQVRAAVFREPVPGEGARSAIDVFFTTLFCGTPLQVSYDADPEVGPDGSIIDSNGALVSADGMYPQVHAAVRTSQDPRPDYHPDGAEPRASRDLEIETRHIDYTVSVGDFDPSAAHEIVVEGQRYLVTLRWSFRASKTVPLLYSFIGVELGFGSFLYHAWFNEPSSLADYAGMLSIAVFALTYAIARTRFPGACGAWIDRRDNLVRPWFKTWPQSFRALLFWVLFCTLYVAFFLMRVLMPTDPTEYIFGICLGGALLWEFIMITIKRWSAQQPAGQVRSQYILVGSSGAAMIIAYAIWQTDTRRIVCFPDSWYQGHTVWHVLTALAYYVLFVYYFVESSHVYTFRCDWRRR